MALPETPAERAAYLAALLAERFGRVAPPQYDRPAAHPATRRTPQEDTDHDRARHRADLARDVAEHDAAVRDAGLDNRGRFTPRH